MSETGNQQKTNVDLESYYLNQLSELTTEQLRHYPFAFKLMDAPSARYEEHCYLSYFEIEEQIQKCKTELKKLKGIIS